MNVFSEYHAENIDDVKQILSRNSQNLTGFKIIAALDMWTCLVCGSLDNTILTKNNINEFILHKCLNDNCRCSFVPVSKGFENDYDDINYSSWFNKLSVEDKIEILGEYYDEYKSGKTIKDIAFSLTEETSIKYIINRKKRAELRKAEEAKKPRTKRLTDEQLQEYRELLIKNRKPGDWMSVPENLESEMDIMKRRPPKEQLIRLEYERKKAKIS